ncbi:MAG: hypothetical protein R2811_16400 [Flavobacteriales bacterium]
MRARWWWNELLSIGLYAVALEPDGRIVVAGNAFDGISGDLFWWRCSTPMARRIPPSTARAM